MRPQRWVVEQAFAHLAGSVVCGIRPEIRDDPHEAFLTLAARSSAGGA